MSRFNVFLHGELQDVADLLDKPCSEQEVRAALQNVIIRLMADQAERVLREVEDGK